MNKIDEVLKLKKLLDSGLINQSDFGRLKNQIFEETNNEVTYTNELQSSEIHQNTQERNNDSFDKRKCPQCGSENHVDNNDCIVCKTDLTKFRQPNETHQEPIIENKQSNYLIPIFLIGLLIIFASFFIFKNHQTSPNAEAAQDTTHVEAPINSQDIPQTNYTDTTNISNKTLQSSDIDSNSNSDYEKYNQNGVENIDDENIYNTSGLEEKPDFPGGLDKFYKFIGQNFQVPEQEGLKGKIFVTFVVEKDGSLSDIKVIRDIGYDTGREAIRVLKLCPKWISGKQSGKNVRVLYSLPINIQSAE